MRPAIAIYIGCLDRERERESNVKSNPFPLNEFEAWGCIANELIKYPATASISVNSEYVRMPRAFTRGLRWKSPISQKRSIPWLFLLEQYEYSKPKCHQSRGYKPKKDKNRKRWRKILQITKFNYYYCEKIKAQIIINQKMVIFKKKIVEGGNEGTSQSEKT